MCVSLAAFFINGVNMESDVNKLEKMILQQVELLGGDKLEDKAKAKLLIERSKAMSDLADSYVSINRMKLDVVKELNNNGTLYEKYLGVEMPPVGKLK